MARGKLSAEDRELIAAHRLGKIMRQSSPGINRLTNVISGGEDVKNVVAGSFALKLFDKIFGSTGKKVRNGLHNR